LVYFIFLLSGVSALIYQVAWMKLFGRMFGNTVYSSSLVIAVFMCGLGVGSYVVGGLADRAYRRDASAPLRLYGYSELIIGLFALAWAFLLPAMEPAAAWISTYTQGADGWYELSAGSYALRYLVAIGLLAPVTFVMGGTLTLLIRHVVANRVADAGWRVGLLYGFNTLGAAAGAFFTDFSLIPNLGLFATQGVGVVCNLLAAVLAFRLAGNAVAGRARGASVPAPSAAEARTGAGGQHTTWWVAAAIFLTGFAGLGAEILWFRYLSVLLGGYVAVFSLLLTVILVGIWLGSLAGGYCHRRFGNPARFFIAAQALFALALVAFLTIVDADLVRRHYIDLVPSYRGGSGFSRKLLATWANLYPILLATGVPSLLMGFAYPLANGIVQQTEQGVGNRAGLLYLANTLGAVLGSLAVGFLLVPKVGMQTTVWVLLAFNLGAILFLSLVQTSRSRAGGFGAAMRRFAAPASVAVVGLAVVMWLRLPADTMAMQAVPKGNTSGKLLTLAEDAYQVIAVTESADGARHLLTNGHSMSGNSRWGQRYMRAFSHLPLLHMNQPKAALVICFGVGSTLHAASLHSSLERLEVVDISRDILEHAGYFKATNRDVINAPNVDVFVNDGRLHLWMQPEETYDLVTLEPPPISFSGVSALYTRDFYDLVHSRLKEGGFMSQWLPGYQVPGPIALALVRAFVEVFPDAILLSGAGPELIMIGRKGGPVTLNPDHLRTALWGDPEVAADLTAIHMGSLIDILGTFAASGETMAEVSAGFPAVTDDFPIMEYAVTSRFHESHMPPALFRNDTVANWCPACFTEGRPLNKLGDPPAYFRIQAAYFRSPAFLDYNYYEHSQSTAVALPSDEDARQCLKESPFLTEFFLKLD